MSYPLLILLEQWTNFSIILLFPLLKQQEVAHFLVHFCADGHASKNKVHRYDPQRTKEELNYIAKRVKNINELQLADLNLWYVQAGCCYSKND